MSVYRTGAHWGVTIVREGTGQPDDAGRRSGDELVAVVVNGDQALAERICALLNDATRRVRDSVSPVSFCNWCPEPHSPDPRAHPGGQDGHLPPRVVELMADIKEWSDIAYELWALACNSTTDGHSTEAEWIAARDRLRDRFHAALDKLPDGTDTTGPSTPAQEAL